MSTSLLCAACDSYWSYLRHGIALLGYFQTSYPIPGRVVDTHQQSLVFVTVDRL